METAMSLSATRQILVEQMFVNLTGSTFREKKKTQKS